MSKDSMDERKVRSYYVANSTITHATHAKQVFKENSMRDAFNPAKMKLPREARDSAISPHSRTIILGEDITGSMDPFILDLIQNQFPRLISAIYKIASWNPHVMFMGIGDAECDSAPLQATQFEVDLKMLEQLQQIWLEGRGGGNSYESYILPWYFAAHCISMDCYEKRGEKGFLFTFGDEQPTPYLERSDLKSVFGNRPDVPYPQQSKIYFDDCLEMASEKFYCYHIILNGGRGTSFRSTAIRMWKEKMGGHACYLSEHEYLTELVTTILKMHEGFSKTDALSAIENSYDRSVVSQALSDHEERVEISTSQVTGSADIEEF